MRTPTPSSSGILAAIDLRFRGLSTVSKDAIKQVCELVNAFARGGDRAMGTLWCVGQLAIQSFTRAGLCVIRNPGRSLVDPFFRLLPTVRRVPEYRQSTIVS